jgi:hypothetical protein
MTGSKSFVIPVHSLNKFSEPPDFGYRTDICTLGAESSIGFLKRDRDGGRYSTLWAATWEQGCHVSGRPDASDDPADVRLGGCPPADGEAVGQGCHADVFGRTDGRTIGRWPWGRP